MAAAQWSRLSDEKLLDVRVRDLRVNIKESTELKRAIEQLHEELTDRGIRFRPHFWLSNEWFTPDNVPGVAIPFFLAHPRLRRLELNQMLELEGGTHDWLMRILRHEVGHALDNAYLPHRRRGYRALFGNYALPYPDSYRPKPYTRKFVLHLDMWYAQAHPAEDFAETFAVWLNPASNWRLAYDGWPVMRKLVYVDELMREIGPRAATVTTRRRPHPLREFKITLREHYKRRRRHYSQTHPRFYDRDLRRLFLPSDAAKGSNRDAAKFLSDIRAEMRMIISRWTGESQYTIDKTIADMILRVDALKLRLRKNAADTKMDATMMLAVQTMNYLNDGKHRVAL